MLELWVPITVAAAFLQNARSTVQRHLSGRLSTTGATFTRFVYAFPLAGAYVLVLRHGIGLPLPAPSVPFAVYAALGGIAQIVATQLLLYSFRFRNFAVGTTYSKTETIQAALFGIVVLGDRLSVGAAAAILISLAGVVAISAARQAAGVRGLVLSLSEKPALIGLASGASFAISAVCYRAASLSLGGDGFLMQAAFTLACVTLLQTVLMAIYLRLREPGEMRAVFRAWRVASLAGLFGCGASACWFTAMTLQNVAYVRALGQIELVFTFVASYAMFKERSTRLEIVGILLVVSGILVLLLAG